MIDKATDMELMHLQSVLIRKCETGELNRDIILRVTSRMIHESREAERRYQREAKP